MFKSLFLTHYVTNAATVRHASVGETFAHMQKRAGRAKHSVRRIDALIIKRNAAGEDTFTAVEIKVSLADLRKELLTPEKTNAWAQYVHSFYFFVPPELESVALAEIPKQYGVMGLRYRRARVLRRAKKNPSPKPLPLDTWRRLAGALGKRQFQDIAPDVVLG